MKDIAFSSAHWSVSVSVCVCVPSKRGKPQQSAGNCTPRVSRRWMSTDEFGACVEIFGSRICEWTVQGKGLSCDHLSDDVSGVRRRRVVVC